MSDDDKEFTILIVDDMPECMHIMERILQPYYHLRFTTDPTRVLTIALKENIDLIFMDVMMPEMDGYEVCRRLKAEPLLEHIPVIFVSAMSEVCDEQQGFDVGAVDFLVKPVRAPLVKARAKTHLQLANQLKVARQLADSRTKQLQDFQISAIHMLGEAGHYNDSDTGEHIWRMSAFSAAIAKVLMWPVAKAKMLELAATMHDTGKIGIPDKILKAPRQLSEVEREIMQSHCEIGHNILSQSSMPLFQMAAEISLFHHEKWDGSGYPYGLKADEIPESARIVAIADVFDALTMQRPYKKAWSIDAAFEYIKGQSGKHFDPKLVEIFLQLRTQIYSIKFNWASKQIT